MSLFTRTVISGFEETQILSLFVQHTNSKPSFAVALDEILFPIVTEESAAVRLIVPFSPEAKVTYAKL